LNQIFFGRLAKTYLHQLVIDLNGPKPNLTERLANPPIYAPSGARYRNGLIYYAASGGNETLNGRSYYPGLYTLNPKTMESKKLLDNYYGFNFDTVSLSDFVISNTSFLRAVGWQRCSKTFVLQSTLLTHHLGR
jgi:hypothetical protein